MLERKNRVNADIAVEMIAIRRRRFILPSLRHGSRGQTQVNMARFLSTLFCSQSHLAGQLLTSQVHSIGRRAGRNAPIRCRTRRFYGRGF